MKLIHSFGYFFILSFLNLYCCDGDLRKLSASLNPGCPPEICDENKKDILTLIHIVADGSRDSMHYLWDFTGKPSLFIALTPLNTTVHIDWEAMLQDGFNSLKFDVKPMYTSSIVLNRLFQFNDVKDSGILPPSEAVVDSNVIISYDTNNFTWVRSKFDSTTHHVEVTVDGDNTELFGNGKIKLKLKCFGGQDHDIAFPHLFHSENSTQFDLVFEALKVNSTFKASRFAAELVFISSEERASSNDDTQHRFNIHEKRSLDDEHTPGIFELIEVASPKSYTASRGSYIQYRPVSYTNPERDVSTSTEVHITEPCNLHNPPAQLNGSLAYAYYGYMLDRVLVQGFNVSFGVSGDGFYNKTEYNSWTFVMGYGAPPNEQLSMFVVIVASIGLGLPLLLLVGGGCYMCIKRIRNR